MNKVLQNNGKQSPEGWYPGKKPETIPEGLSWKFP